DRKLISDHSETSLSPMGCQGILGVNVTSRENSSAQTPGGASRADKGQTPETRRQEGPRAVAGRCECKEAACRGGAGAGNGAVANAAGCVVAQRAPSRGDPARRRTRGRGGAN